MKRFILAVILSPFITSLLLSIAEPLFSGRTPNLKLISGMLPLTYIFTLLGVIVFGLPIYFLFKKFNILSLISLTITGFLAGLIYMVLIQFVLISSVPPSINIAELAPSGLMGAISALIFGIIAGIPLKSKQKA